MSKVSERSRQVVRKLFSRGLFGMLSQALNTASNLCIALFLVGQVPSDSFGAWSVGYASFLITMTITRAVATTPLILGSTGIPPRKQVKGGLSLSIGIGVLAGLSLAIAAVLAGPEIGEALWGFVLVTPVLCLQDGMRYIFIRRFTPGKAAVLDGIRLTLQLSAFAYLLHTDSVTLFNATITWGFAALASCAVGFAFHGVLPSLAAGIDFIKANKWASGRLLADSIVSGVSSNGIAFVLSALVGLSAAGALRAAQTLMGGVGLLVMGMTPIVVTESIQKVRNGSHGWMILWIWTMIVGTFSGLYGIGVLMIPEDLGMQLFGETWQDVSLILVPLVLQAILRGPYTGATILLRAGYLLNSAVKLRILTSIPNIVIPAFGAAFWGLQGAAWGMVLAAIWANVQSIAAIKWTRGRPPENASKSFEGLPG